MKEYLLTGATGFLGRIIYNKIKDDTFTLGRSNQNDIIWNFSSIKSDLPQVKIVIHCAGKAHMLPKNDEQREDFIKVNHLGIKYLTQSLQASKSIPNSFIFISTVAVYGLESGNMINENHPLLGVSPYAKSKILAEEELIQWCKKNDVKHVILRLPLIAGNHPPGNLGAMIKAIKNGYYFGIGNSSAQKSIVLADDIADLIPNLKGKKGIFNLTDRTHPSMRDIESSLASRFGKKVRVIPSDILKTFAKLGDFIPLFPVNSVRMKKLTNTLTFDDQKAFDQLGWRPSPVLVYFKHKIEG